MPQSDRLLVLLRHGQSDWNLKNLFTGWKDPDLTPLGVEEAKAAGRRLKARGLCLRRRLHLGADPRPAHAGADARRTRPDRPARRRATRRSTSATTATSPASTRTTRARNGARSRSICGGAATTSPPPGGESLKDTVARALPYYCQHILPAVLRGERVLVAAHGNSLRALVMVLDRPDAQDDPRHGARDRRAAGLPAEGGFDGRVQGHP